MSQSFSHPARTLGIGAAGSESSVMRRLRHGAWRRRCSWKQPRDGKGELFFRIAPGRRAGGLGSFGAHINAAPLSARDYRLSKTCRAR